MSRELTVDDVISDPMIAMVNAADKIDAGQFDMMMQAAADAIVDPACTACDSVDCPRTPPQQASSPKQEPTDWNAADSAYLF